MALTQVSTGGIKDGQVQTADLADGQVTVGKLHADALDHTYTLGASGTDHYTFTGEGLTGAVNDPTLYLTRGKTYRFVNGNSAGAHPFRIQTTVNGSAGTEYNTGVTNNGGAGGSTIVFEVPHAAPDVLYYQCTSHGSMGGILYVTGALADGTVTTAKLADDAVDGTKIADDAVDSEHIAADSIDAEHYAPASVDTTAIADQAVTLAKLEHGTSSNDGKFLRANNGADPTFETVSGTTINNNADNRVITGSGTANTLEGEADLVFYSGELSIAHTNPTFKLTDTTNNTDAFLFSDDNGSIRLAADFNSEASDSRIRMSTDGTERVSIAEHLTISDGNLVIGTSGHGIDFSATGDGSGTSNVSELLSDFETGTFSLGGPVLGGGSFTASVARYTRIGNVCHVFVSADSFSTSGQNFDLQLSGLPFTSSSTQTSMALVSTNKPGLSNGIKAQIFANNTTIAIRTQWGDDGLKSQDFNGYGIHFNATYIVG
jgi:hypothetical protein